jgi:hypothetical protein
MRNWFQSNNKLSEIAALWAKFNVTLHILDVKTVDHTVGFRFANELELTSPTFPSIGWECR